MRVQYTSTNGRVRVEFDADGQKGLFTALADVAAVLEVEPCGQCESEAVVHEHYVAKGFDYYKLRCTSCSAALGFGQYRDGKGLFVKRKDEDGREIGKNGWHHWQQGGQPMAQTTGKRANDDLAEFGGSPY